MNRPPAARPQALLVGAALLMELVALTMLGCGGGGGGSIDPGPLLPWARLRRGDTNSAIAANDIGDNHGVSSLIYTFKPGETPTGYPPLVGRDSSIYLTLEDQLISVDGSGEGEAAERWRIEACTLVDPGTLEPVSPPTVLPLAPVSSLAIAPNGRDLFIGSVGSTPEDGYIFRFNEPEKGDDPPNCLVAFPVGSRSAAIAAVDQVDLELLSFVIGTESGRLTSITSNGERRWSFPESDPLPTGISSAPSLVSAGGIVFTAPNGRLYSVDPVGRPRWNAVIGGAYDEDDLTPSPAFLDQIFTVSAEGEVVAFTPGGTRLWTFTPDAPIVGSVAVSALTTDGGSFLGQNVVFALDDEGTIYGIGSNTGELIQYCEADNRACRPSNCADWVNPENGITEPAPCLEVSRCSESNQISCGNSCPNDEVCSAQRFCSETTNRPCEESIDCPPDESCTVRFCSATTDRQCADSCPSGESCTQQLFCQNDETRECFQDLCSGDEEDGLCRRDAKLPLPQTLQPGVFRTAPVLSSGSYVVAATSDGRVCARRLDGTVPDGRCGLPGEDAGGSDCTPDSCGSDDACCGLDEADCDKPGYCKGDPSRACTPDTCENEGEVCMTVWDDGCVDLGVAGATTLSPAIVDANRRILVYTEKGLAAVE